MLSQMKFKELTLSLLSVPRSFHSCPSELTKISGHSHIILSTNISWGIKPKKKLIKLLIIESTVCTKSSHFLCFSWS
jgi:hypothetical protein